MFGLVFNYFGYVANVAQTPRSLRGIILSMSWIPCVLMLLATALMQLYPLDEALMLIQLLAGTVAAQQVQQQTQYYPNPPVDSAIPPAPSSCLIPQCESD